MKESGDSRLQRYQRQMLLPHLGEAGQRTLLASKVDGVLLIVKASSTQRDHVKAAKDRLEKVNARLIGAVLTNAPADATLQYT